MGKPLRKLALSTALALCLAAPASAQVTLGVHGGASIAGLGGSDVIDAGARTGINIGYALTFPVSPTLGIQVGLGWVQKGATASSDGVGAELAVDYLETPVLLRIGVPTTGAISPHFVVGPALSFRAGRQASRTDNGAPVIVPWGDAEPAIRFLDIGGMAGAGVDIATAGALTVTLDVTYSLGFASIDSSGYSDVKNRAWSVLVGLARPIG